MNSGLRTALIVCTLGLSAILTAIPTRLWAATLSDIRQRGYLIVAVKDNLYPLGYRDDRGTWQGFEIALAKRLAMDLFGSEQALRLTPVSNVDRLAAVASGAVDLAIAQVTITETRMRQVSFSDAYYRNGTGILARNPKWNGLQTLYRQAIAVLQPSVTLAHLPSRLPLARLKGVPSYVAAQQLLDSGQVEAIVGDQLVLSALARRQPQYFFAPTTLTVQPLGMAMPKGVQYESLRQWVNHNLRQWQQQGWLEQQRQVWGLP
ncbi:MAG: transporter substrate-binding domain-containing protein [Thermosynechococcaceae cyanobacterium]